MSSEKLNKKLIGWAGFKQEASREACFSNLLKVVKDMVGIVK